jgi:hypothetical protein
MKTVVMKEAEVPWEQPRYGQTERFPGEKDI